MKVLVIGSGGREHALVLALAADEAVDEVHAAPGNAGIAALAAVHPVDPLDGEAVAALAARLGADLVVIGPEAPLVAGVADAVRAAGVVCFGPTAEAARLEGSKAFAKEVMAAAGVPTAMAHVCTTEQRGRGRAGRVRRAVRGQGRRPGCRQGRGGDRRPRGSAGARPLVRGRRRRGGGRGVPRRPGGVAVRGDRRPDGGAAGAGAGLQAAGRRRHRPQHRRHGCLRPAVVGTRRPGRRRDGTGAGADRRRDGAARHAVRRPALCRAGADVTRAAGRRVQRAVRRPRDPGGAAAARVVARHAAARGRDRPAGVAPPAAVARWRRRHRGRRLARLPRRAAHRRPGRRAGRRRRAARACRCVHAGTARRRRCAPSPPAGGCWR